MPRDVEIYVDGACSGNPGPGGWAYLLRTEDNEMSDSGGEPSTTNQRMELTAAIRALEALESQSNVRLYSDSQYLIQGMTEWINGWIANGWRTAGRKPVANRDLWEQLIGLTRENLWNEHHEVQWIQVPGHAGNRENELVDRLARAAIERYR